MECSNYGFSCGELLNEHTFLCGRALPLLKNDVQNGNVLGLDLCIGDVDSLRVSSLVQSFLSGLSVYGNEFCLAV